VIIKTAENNQGPAGTKARYRAVVREFEHAERVMEKKHRVEVLRALLEMHQQQDEPDDEYVKGLRQRLKQAQIQLDNMRP
jgi:DNA-binding SARP family transcriptional activator